MREYRRASHLVYGLRYHFVFLTKYRKPLLRGEIGDEVRAQYIETQDAEVQDDDFRISE